MASLLVAALISLVPAAALADARQACRDLVLDYAFYRDRPDAHGVANLFTEDAELSILGETWRGRQAIYERIVAGADGPLFRHLMSTIRIFPESETRARGVSYVTVYTAPPGEGPRPLDAPAAVGEYHDVFVKTNAGWQIAERRFVPVLMPGQE